MWMFVSLMGALLASSVVDTAWASNNGNADRDDEGDDYGGERPPDDPWLDEWEDDEYISDDKDPPEDDDDGDDKDGGDDDDNGDGDGDGERPPDDPWLDEWEDDEYISDDTDPPEDDDDGDDKDGGDDDDNGDGDGDGERPPDDPWLDEPDNDEYVSSDSITQALARAQDDETLHVMGSGDRLAAGDGGVYVLGDWIEATGPAVIEGFEPGTDQLIYAHEAEAGAPIFTLTDAAEAGAGGGAAAGNAALLADGQPVLFFEGGTAPQADSVLPFAVSLDQGAPAG